MLVREDDLSTVRFVHARSALVWERRAPIVEAEKTVGFQQLRWNLIAQLLPHGDEFASISAHYTLVLILCTWLLRSVRVPVVFCTGLDDKYQVMILRCRIIVFVKPNIESRCVPNV